MILARAGERGMARLLLTNADLLDRAAVRRLLDAGVEAVERRRGEWIVTTPAGMFAAPILINASGAWGDVLARMAGAAPIGLVPHRRTAFTFAAPPGRRPAHWANRRWWRWPPGRRPSGQGP